MLFTESKFFSAERSTVYGFIVNCGCALFYINEVTVGTMQSVPRNVKGVAVNRNGGLCHFSGNGLGGESIVAFAVNIIGAVLKISADKELVFCSRGKTAKGVGVFGYKIILTGSQVKYAVAFGTCGDIPTDCNRVCGCGCNFQS